MKSRYLSFTVLTFFVIISGWSTESWCFHPEEAPPSASISIGAEFSTGRYNSQSTTSSIYMPLIVSWYPTVRLDMSVELPFIYQSSSQVTTSLYQNSTATNTQTVARRGGPGGNFFTATGDTTGTGLPDTSTGNSTSGLGDIILRAGYIPLFERDYIPQLRGSLFVKTPTASVSEGLGTGEFDYGGGFDISKWLGDFHLAAESLYTRQGKVRDFGLKDYVSYSFSTGYQATRNIQPILIVKGASAPSSVSDNLLELRCRLLWNLSSRTALDGFISRGLSTSSPDFGGGMSAVMYF